MKRILTVVALTVIIPSAFAQSQSPEQAAKDFIDFYDKGNLEKMASLYSEDATILPSSGGEMLQGRTAIKEYFRKAFDSTKSRRIESEGLEWQKYGDFAVRTSKGKIEVERNDGQKAVFPFRSTYVYKKNSAGWQIVHTQVSRWSPADAVGKQAGK